MFVGSALSLALTANPKEVTDVGMFDSVKADCPECGNLASIEFQSKGGTCGLIVYPASAVPLDVALDLGDGECNYCHLEFRVKIFSKIVHVVQVGVI